MKSPLLIGGDLQTMALPYVEILSNREVIAWNQDDAGVQGTLRASSPYLDGEGDGQQLPPAAIAAIARHRQRFHEATKASGSSPLATALGVSAAMVGNKAKSEEGAKSAAPDAAPKALAFHGLTYCAFGTAPPAQIWSLVVPPFPHAVGTAAIGSNSSTDSGDGGGASGDRAGDAAGAAAGAHRNAVAATTGTSAGDNAPAGSLAVQVRQGSTCLTAGGTTNALTSMSACIGSLAQLWEAHEVSATVSQIKSKVGGRCLTVNNKTDPANGNGMALTTVPCVKKPTNCSSLWWHNSSKDGRDCTDSPRVAQLW
jgi:hypothetical protein